MKKELIPSIYLLDGRPVAGFCQRDVLAVSDLQKLARQYSDNGADALLLFNLSGSKEEDAAIADIREVCTVAEIPVYGAGNIAKTDDVKKLLYSGCRKAILNFSKSSNVEILEEVSKRFGKERIGISIAHASEFEKNQRAIEKYASLVICMREDLVHEICPISDMDLLVLTDLTSKDELVTLFENKNIVGVTGPWISSVDQELTKLKYDLKNDGLEMHVLESSLQWSDFKLNGDGMIPVIVQDYKNDEVLMLAYMNEEAFLTTLNTGKMTYWSRSRNELWTKGLTSGHVQYVKSLAIDCDNDTILAKVSQIGAACHTGNRSCFYRDLVTKDYQDSNPLTVLTEIYELISDRKENPREGSNTNYLFDKGIDKILKKVGEGSARILIAGKNPEKETLQYEISDYLYHLMVLMREKNITWEDITEELSRHF